MDNLRKILSHSINLPRNIKYRFSTRATSIGKRPHKNEDRVLYTDYNLALADGVGCWANLGVDSGKFA